MNWVYQQSEKNLWTVGYYNPKGLWYCEGDHDSPEKAAARVHYLNGGVSRSPANTPFNDALVEALKPFAKAAEEYKATLSRPIGENALEECIEIEVGFCENARQAIANYGKTGRDILFDAVKPLESAPGFGDVDGLADYEEIEVRITIGQVRAIQSALAKHEKAVSKQPDALVEALKKIPLGRLLCGQCDSWDHECGCSPNIIERTRQEFVAAHKEAGGTDGT